jgi:TonB family protein
MLLAALLIAAAPVAQDVPADQGEDIVVTGKLMRLKVSVQTNRKGRVTACGIDRTSGDAAFDRAACESTVACSNRTPRNHDAVSGCVRDRMLGFARAQAGHGTEERE